MMKTKQNRPLWRVDWYHRAGYQAPYQFVEAKKRKDAAKLAKAGSRLGDFPKSWSFKLTKLFVSEEEK